jgi:hypothetical protein
MREIASHLTSGDRLETLTAEAHRETAVEPPLGFSGLFEGLQIVIDADQKMAICPLRC